MKPLVAAALGLWVTSALAQPVTYVVDPTHTFVTYEIGHFGVSTNRGRFDRKEGTVQLDRAARQGRVEIRIDLASVNTGVEGLNKHLQSDSFFDTARTPTASFVGDQFVFDGDKVAQVTGTLTLRDKAAPVTLKASNFGCYLNPLIRREVCGGDFEATIKRSQWGITYGAQVAPDEVRLLIQVEAIRQ